MRDLFARFARASAQAIGSVWTFTTYCVLVLIWLASGPLFHWNDAFQLVGNTVTSLATTAICLLIQNTMNSDTRALHKKLDELLRAHSEARRTLVDLEHRPQHEVDEREHEFAVVRDQQTESH